MIVANPQTNFTEVVEIDGEMITFNHYSNDTSRFIAYQQNFKSNIMEFNTLTGIMKLNNQIISTSFPVEAVSNNLLYSSPSARYNNVWKLYSTTTGDVVSDLSTAAAIAAYLCLAAGFGLVSDFMSIASDIFNLGVGLVYYVNNQYYIDPIIGSRPITGHNISYYTSPGSIGYIGSYDTRY